MKAALLILLSALFSSSALGAEWVYEFEFGGMLPSSDRLLLPGCTKVVPRELVQWYAIDPRPGWEISCGNRQPYYLHFLGRNCGRPLPRLRFECGWRHFSSPADKEEVSFDALAIRGRFSWGK